MQKRITTMGRCPWIIGLVLLLIGQGMWAQAGGGRGGKPDPEVTATVTKQANVRRQANNNSAIVAVAKVGATLTVIGDTSGAWINVRTEDGKTGFVNKDYVRINSAQAPAPHAGPAGGGAPPPPPAPPPGPTGKGGPAPKPARPTVSLADGTAGDNQFTLTLSGATWGGKDAFAAIPLEDALSWDKEEWPDGMLIVNSTRTSDTVVTITVSMEDGSAYTDTVTIDTDPEYFSNLQRLTTLGKGEELSVSANTPVKVVIPAVKGAKPSKQPSKPSSKPDSKPRKGAQRR